MGAAGTAGTPGSAVELALRLTATGAMAVVRLRLALTVGATLRLRLAISFWPVRGTRTVTPLIIATLAIPVLRA